MNPQKTFMLFLALVLSANYSFAQLSGYYTIGGSNADYETIYLALDDLQSQGISSETIFALNPGSYSGFDINTIEGSSPNSYFILESATNDPSDVIIEGSVEIYSVEFVKLRKLSFITTDDRNLYVYKSRFLYFENNIFESEYDEGGNSDAAVKIFHNTDDDMYISNIMFDSCQFTSPSPNIYSYGQRGDLIIHHSIFNALDGGLCIHAWNNYKVKIDHVEFNGGIDINVNISAYSYLKNATILGEVNAGKFDTVLNTNVYCNMIIKLTSDYFENCHFEGTEFRDSSHGTNGGSWFINNHFDCPVKVGWASFPKIINNVFNGGIHLSFNDALLFEQNIVYGDFYWGDVTATNWNYKVFNNIFIGGQLIARGHNSIISYNTFIDSANLYLEYASIEVYENLFCTEITGWSIGEKIAHNNFYPLEYCQFDTISTHYDPMYSDEIPGMATNPLLQGKGLYEAPETDYFGNTRQYPAAMGANEIFVCSDSLNNEITVPCYEELYLNFCNIPDTGDFWWDPTNCVENPDAAYTMVEACENGMSLYLYNSITGLVDSITIYTEAFEVEVADMPTFYCDYPRRITASYHPNANYHWNPEYGLSDPYSRTPVLNVDDTDYLEYVIACDIEGCGVSYDTLYIDFDSLPYPQLYYPQQSHDTVYFECTSRCTDAYLWDFGDGTSSTEKEPFHIYAQNGTYTITLTVYNEYGSQSGSFDYNYYWLENEEVNTTFKELKIFPNPADDMITINGLKLNQENIISILSIKGEILYNQSYSKDQLQINTENLKNGIYIIKISSGEASASRKIIIGH